LPFIFKLQLASEKREPVWWDPHNMSEMWSTFARTGHPAAKGQPHWPAYDTEKRATMEINAQCKVVDDPYALERKLWESLES
jgi:para-nitrobenzyl esterase